MILNDFKYCLGVVINTVAYFFYITIYVPLNDVQYFTYICTLLLMLLAFFLFYFNCFSNISQVQGHFSKYFLLYFPS